MKVATLDLALKSQDRGEANFDKAMKLYHSAINSKTSVETELKDLQERVAVWLPNFTKYQASSCFEGGLKFILPDTLLDYDM